jgi:hypothetical protein
MADTHFWGATEEEARENREHATAFFLALIEASKTNAQEGAQASTHGTAEEVTKRAA